LEKKKINALNKLHNLIVLTRSDTDGKAYGLELSFIPPPPKKIQTDSGHYKGKPN